MTPQSTTICVFQRTKPNWLCVGLPSNSMVIVHHYDEMRWSEARHTQRAYVPDRRRST